MKGLVLHGAEFEVGIWEYVREQFGDYDLEYVSYPHEIIQNATSISDIAKWVESRYGQCKYDAIIGHSMGGQIALERVSTLVNQPDILVLVESNPVPFSQFNRNLMTDKNMELFKKMINDMDHGETPSYQEKLAVALSDDFDFLENIREFQGAVHAIYGNQGTLAYDIRLEQIDMLEDVLDKMEVHFIEESCHLPMVENPREFAKVLRGIFDEEKPSI